MDVQLVRRGDASGAYASRIGGVAWQEQVIRAVAAFESAGDPYEAQRRNTDGQGLSFGLIQWTQRSGQLGQLLTACSIVDRPAFDAIMGTGAAELLRVTSSASESTRMSLPLWTEPWTSRFKTLGRHPAFQLVQVELAQRGYHWQTATKIAGILGGRSWSPRAWAVFFDRSVQTPARAVEEATKLAARFGRGLAGVGEWALLDHFIEAVAGRYSGNTYQDIRVRRGNALLSDPSLSDGPISTT